MRVITASRISSISNHQEREECHDEFLLPGALDIPASDLILTRTPPRLEHHYAWQFSQLTPQERPWGGSRVGGGGRKVSTTKAPALGDREDRGGEMSFWPPYPSPRTLPHPQSQEQLLLRPLWCQPRGTLSRTDETCPLKVRVLFRYGLSFCHSSLGVALCYQQSCQRTDYTQADKIWILRRDIWDFSQRMTETASVGLSTVLIFGHSHKTTSSFMATPSSWWKARSSLWSVGLHMHLPPAPGTEKHPQPQPPARSGQPKHPLSPASQESTTRDSNSEQLPMVQVCLFVLTAKDKRRGMECIQLKMMTKLFMGWSYHTFHINSLQVNTMLPVINLCWFLFGRSSWSSRWGEMTTQTPHTTTHPGNTHPQFQAERVSLIFFKWGIFLDFLCGFHSWKII